MPAALMSKETVVQRLLETFRLHGYDGASLAELSKITGLGKSSLYHHFPGGKTEMALAVLDHVDAWMTEAFLVPLHGSAPVADRLDDLLAALSGFYADGERACILERLCASTDRAQFQARLGGSFDALIDAIRALLVQAGATEAVARARAEDAVIRIEGALVLAAARGHGDAFRRVMADLRAHLLDKPAPKRRRHPPTP